MADSVEQVFADVADLTPQEHKNVLGDKWKYINAINERIVNVLEAEKKQKQMCIDDLIRQLRERTATTCKE